MMVRQTVSLLISLIMFLFNDHGGAGFTVFTYREESSLAEEDFGETISRQSLITRLALAGS